MSIFLPPNLTKKAEINSSKLISFSSSASQGGKQAGKALSGVISA
jgi:hypothetical protein